MNKTTKSYPDNNPKTREGLKKPQMHLVSAAARIAFAKVFELGAKKYGPYNWRNKKVSSTIYYDAAIRHLDSWLDGEDDDPESGESHLAHAGACIIILLDAFSMDMINDNRPIPGKAAEEIRKRII